MQRQLDGRWSQIRFRRPLTLAALMGAAGETEAPKLPGPGLSVCRQAAHDAKGRSDAGRKAGRLGSRNGLLL